MAKQQGEKNAIAEAKKGLVEAQEMFDEVKKPENAGKYSEAEIETVKLQLEDAKLLVEQLEKKERPVPTTPPDASPTQRKFHTISCVNAFGMYPKLGVRFRNFIAVVNDEQLAAVKESPAWNKSIFPGTKAARPRETVKVVKPSSAE